MSAAQRPVTWLLRGTRLGLDQVSRAAAAALVRVLRLACQRRRLLGVLGLVAALASIGAAAPAAACGPPSCPDPSGLAGQLPGPDLKGSNAPTLFEAYPSDMFTNVDRDLGATDIPEQAAAFLIDIGMTLLVLVIRGCLVLAQWITSQHVFADLLAGAGTAITAVADAVYWPLLPVSLSVGVMAAYTLHTRERKGLSEFAWVIATAVIGIALISQPVRYLTDANNARVSLSAAVTGAMSSAAGDGLNTPIPASPTYNGDSATEATRKVSDAIWRTYVVAPWCLEEFGSLEMCQKYGKRYLDDVAGGTKTKDAMNAIRHDHSITSDNTDHWMVGKSTGGRIGIMLLSIITSLPFAVLILALAIGALMALIMAIALAILGGLFLLGWPVKGRPRTWANSWFNHLFGAFVQAFTASAVLALALLITSLILRLTSNGQYGYFMVTIINLAATFTAFRYRRMLETILEVATPGHMSPLVGALAAGGLLKGAGLLRRALPRPRIPKVNWEDWKKRGTPNPPKPPRPTTEAMRHVHRPMPELPEDPGAAALTGAPPSPRPLGGAGRAAIPLPSGEPIALPGAARAASSMRPHPRPGRNTSRGPGWDPARPVQARRFDPQSPAGPATRPTTRPGTGSPQTSRPPVTVRTLPPVIDVVPVRVTTDTAPTPARGRRRRRG
jgi:hypothetical protein